MVGNEARSALSELARLLFLGREPGLLAMLACYLDASGKTSDIGSEREPLLVVAGLLATVDQWERFQERWRVMLAKYGLTASHMKDFAHSKKEYKGWPEHRRRQYVRDCASVIRDSVLCGHAEGIAVRAHDRLARPSDQLSAFSSASIGVMKNLNEWRKRNMPGQHIAHFFERGDGHEGEIIRMDELVRVNPYFKALSGLNSLTVMCKSDPSGEPLQPADMVAYEYRKYLRDTYLKVGKKRRVRGSFRALQEIDELTFTYLGEKELAEVYADMERGGFR